MNQGNRYQYQREFVSVSMRIYRWPIPQVSTYIRIAGTSRPADTVKIRELEMEGVNLSWDELTCVGYKVTDDAVNLLCKDMKRYMVESASTEEDKKAVWDVTLEHLLNWKVLERTEGEIFATNSFVLLTGDYFSFS